MTAPASCAGPHILGAHECPGCERPVFTCPRCRRTSHHPQDAAHGYCGACHAFTGDEAPAAAAGGHGRGDEAAFRAAAPSRLPGLGIEQVVVFLPGNEHDNDCAFVVTSSDRVEGPYSTRMLIHDTYSGGRWYCTGGVHGFQTVEEAAADAERRAAAYPDPWWQALAGLLASLDGLDGGDQR